jgi:hypothetical protein
LDDLTNVVLVSDAAAMRRFRDKEKVFMLMDESKNETRMTGLF